MVGVAFFPVLSDLPALSLPSQAPLPTYEAPRTLRQQPQYTLEQHVWVVESVNKQSGLCPRFRALTALRLAVATASRIPDMARCTRSCCTT